MLLPQLAAVTVERVESSTAELRIWARPKAERAPYCHGDVHEPNLLVERAEDGAGSLTGLLDPANMHAGDPLMDFVRLDDFSINGDTMKITGLLTGYDTPGPGRQPGKWPDAWRSRLRLYHIAFALELYNWFTISRQTSRLAALDRQLRELVDEAGARA